MGGLRRAARAGSIEGSTSIEGFSVPADRAIELVRDGGLAEPRGESQMAVACYARAMDRVEALADDPSFRWLDRIILDLHFDACQFQRDKWPGRWRLGQIGVTGADGSLEFRGPEPERVPDLMAEVVEWLGDGDLEAHVAVRAAMAHLHVTSVHPFEDGNGRIARIVQSLVLAREGLVSAELASIEEYLAQHTSQYYAALRETQGGGYNPERDASRWVEFCLDAHLAQARRRLAQIESAATRWERLEEIVAQHGWPDRLVIALEQSLAGGTDRALYSREAGVSPASASADLRRLVDAGLLEVAGKGRNTRYQPGARLQVDL
ncbi:MAG TPA: Fic family protein [Solirubrobacterales bacterium]|nr:Fic family protein [Solirubrobacterales bacterium]